MRKEGSPILRRERKVARQLILGLLISMILVCAFASELNVPPTRAGSEIIIVPDQYTTIQEAINHAADGDTVFVREGTYYENGIVVNKSISLTGQDASTTIIDGSFIRHVVNITSDHVTMTGFTVRNSGTAYHVTGINLNNVNYCNVSGNIMTNNEHALELHNYSYYNIISRNIITKNNKYGMHIIDSHYNNVSGNTIEGSLWGSIGIHGYSTYNHVFENDLGNNTNYCIIIDGSKYNRIYRNNIANNTWGISVQYSSGYNTITYNNIANNGYAINLESNAYVNTFHHNNFVNNTYKTSISGYNYGNLWDNGYPSGGNYWSDYKGKDLNADGIGDTPHIISGDNVDHYPLMNKYITGDVNYDGTVNDSDLFLLATAWGTQPGKPNWNIRTDFNQDQIINTVDLFKLGKNFGKTTP